MQRSEPRRNGLSIGAEKAPRRKTNAWNQDFDKRKRRAPGLWERNNSFYAEINVGRKPIRFKLEHATTVPQPVTAQQVLKAQQRAGTLKLPADAAVPEQVEAGTKTLEDAIQFYREDRKALKDKDPKTCERENSGLNKLSQFGGKHVLNTIDNEFRFDFAKWRRSTKAETKPKKKKKKKEKQPVSGRTVDLEVMALGHVIDVCIREDWLIQSPFRRKWKKPAKRAEKARLILTEELNRFCEIAVE
jgi:hypothetical protein